MDEIPSEVWKYGGEEMRRWAWGICNRIWKGEDWPEEWSDNSNNKKGKGGGSRRIQGSYLDAVNV